jgi:hypothetical protein
MDPNWHKVIDDIRPKLKQISEQLEVKTLYCWIVSEVDVQRGVGETHGAYFANGTVGNESFRVEHPDPDLLVVAFAEAAVVARGNARIKEAGLELHAALTDCRDTLKAQMAENWYEEEWPQTVFWDAYDRANKVLEGLKG